MEKLRRRADAMRCAAMQCEESGRRTGRIEWHSGGEYTLQTDRRRNTNGRLRAQERENATVTAHMHLIVLRGCR